MLVTFSSNAYENITYFNDVAGQLLSLMGHSGTIPGALKADEVADALTSLQHALQGQKESTLSENDDDKEPAIDLKKRAVPLLNLLQAAAKKKSHVLWTSSNSPG